MPKPLAVDWHEVRTLALVVGPVEAARQMGLPVDAVKRRCSREGWLVKQKAATVAAKAATAIVREGQGLSPFVPSAADVLSRLEPDSRLKLAVAGNNAVTHLSKLSPAKIAGQTQPLLNAGKVLSVAHRWGEPTQAGQVMVNVNLLGVELPCVEVAQVLDAEALPVSIEQKPE